MKIGTEQRVFVIYVRHETFLSLFSFLLRFCFVHVMCLGFTFSVLVLLVWKEVSVYVKK